MILYLLIALIIDKTFGEFKHFHPLVGFGNLANFIEKRFNTRKYQTNLNKRFFARFGSRSMGLICHICITLPIVSLVYFSLRLLDQSHILALLSGFILYACIGWNSLLLHANNIISPLLTHDIKQARIEIGKIVSRDTNELDETAISKATIESVLENGADAIFSAVFWFVIMGYVLGLEAACTAAVFYRLINTLDAMWGYKTDRFLHFGWFAARMDDALNFIPARLTAISYALMGNFHGAITFWKQQGSTWKSPNAGPVMSSGAGAINVSLGGGAMYHGNWQERDTLGPKQTEQTIACASKIKQACALVTRSVILWVVIISMIDVYRYMQ